MSNYTMRKRQLGEKSVKEFFGQSKEDAQEIPKRSFVFYDMIDIMFEEMKSSKRYVLVGLEDYEEDFSVEELMRSFDPKGEIRKEYKFALAVRLQNQLRKRKNRRTLDVSWLFNCDMIFFGFQNNTTEERFSRHKVYKMMIPNVFSVVRKDDSRLLLKFNISEK